MAGRMECPARERRVVTKNVATYNFRVLSITRESSRIALSCAPDCVKKSRVEVMRVLSAEQTKCLLGRSFWLRSDIKASSPLG